jgi:hypothetical protein
VNVLKDSGHGVTQDSLAFWRANRVKIGSVLSLECKNDLRGMLSSTGIPLEYTCIVYGRDGEIWLSGCTCGYSGEGPHGTARVLVDIGVPKKRALQMMLEKVIAYHKKRGKETL